MGASAEIGTDRAVKDKHRAMWALGDYPSVAADLIPDLGALLVAACGVGPGQRVLDVATGSGNAAIPAAMAGAEVVACDLTPELLAAGEQLAVRRNVSLLWQQADAEALPYADDEFDTVLSCVGVMFTPNHQASADELIRVCRPGGTIGLLSWTPQGFLGQMLAAMKPYVPPPPAGSQPPPLWGDEAHVRELFGDRVSDVTATRQSVTVTHFATAEQFCDYFKHNYGPTVAAYRGIAESPDRVAGLDRDLASLARHHNRGTGTVIMDWEYLLLTARKRS